MTLGATVGVTFAKGGPGHSDFPQKTAYYKGK